MRPEVKFGEWFNKVEELRKVFRDTFVEAGLERLLNEENVFEFAGLLSAAAEDLEAEEAKNDVKCGCMGSGPRET